MKQVAWYFVGMEEEINNEGKKISASTCISHFLSFEVVNAAKIIRVKIYLIRLNVSFDSGRLH